jgi:hypothetical protein
MVQAKWWSKLMIVMLTEVTTSEDQVLQHGKEGREKQKPRLIMTKVSNKFLFYHLRYYKGCEWV